MEHVQHMTDAIVRLLWWVYAQAYTEQEEAMMHMASLLEFANGELEAIILTLASA